MTTNAAILDLLTRHVLWGNEEVERVKEWPDGIGLATRLRHMTAGSEPTDWAISREDWVSDVVIATRDDLIIDGQAERYGFVLLADGTDAYVNDAIALANIGRRLGAGMNPVGYAELLVQFHPYSSATRMVLTEPDQLRRQFDRADLPEVTPPRLLHTDEAVTLTFTSAIWYARPLGQRLLDLMEWTVRVPADQPAQWESRLTAERIELERWSAPVASR